MTRYLVARVFRALFTVVGVVTAVFILVRILPGDPVLTMLGDQAAPEDQAALRAALHLEAPPLAQYGAFVRDVLNGTLGFSFRKRDTPVSELVFAALPATATLALAALVVALILGVVLGVLAAAFDGRAADAGAQIAAVGGLAVPTICLGPLLILVFGLWLRWLPLPGGAPGTAPLDTLAELVLPALTVGTTLSAILLRQTRAAMIHTLSQPFITAARARGVRPLRILFVHALRNALLPVSTVAAAQLGALLSGTVITEKIFEREGLGTLFLEAFFSRDIPVVQGTVLVVAFVYVAVNLLVDVTYGVIDPRVRLS